MVITSPSRAPAPRLALLDGIRFFAAMGVIAYHYTAYPNSFGWPGKAESGKMLELFPEIARFTVFGSLGVHLFFIISGFVILLSAWGRSIPQFVASRVSRIFPAYWCAVLATGVLLVFLTGERLELRRVLVNLTLLQEPFGVLKIDGVYWTLWVELCFYIIIGVLLLRGITYGKIVAVIALWPLGAVMLGTREGILGQLLIPVYAPLFAGGMALFLIYRCGHSLLHWGLVVLNLVLSVQQTVTGNATWTPQITGIAMNPGIVAVVILGCFGLVALATLTPARTFSGRFGSWLGRLTYPLYLFHNVWGLWIIAWTVAWAGTFGAIGIALLGSLFAAWAVNRWVEKPWAGKLRRSVERSLGRRDQPAHAAGRESMPVGVRRDQQVHAAGRESMPVGVRRDQQVHAAGREPVPGVRAASSAVVAEAAVAEPALRRRDRRRR